jgi:hypothetical protein
MTSNLPVVTDRLTEALTELATEDPESGRLAEDVVNWLTSGEGVETSISPACSVLPGTSFR